MEDEAQLLVSEPNGNGVRHGFAPLESGQGVGSVDLVSDAWGVDTDEQGENVWSGLHRAASEVWMPQRASTCRGGEHRRRAGSRRGPHDVRVCATTPTSHMNLPAALSSARLAREFVRENWCVEHDSADLAQAQLIVTELVTNAVRYGGPPIELQVECVISSGVVLSVSDGTPEEPVAQEEDRTRWGGHGVALVDLLSAEWGVHRHPEHGQHHERQHGQVQHHERPRRQPAGSPREHPRHRLHREEPAAHAPAKTVWCRLVV